MTSIPKKWFQGQREKISNLVGEEVVVRDYLIMPNKFTGSAVDTYVMVSADRKVNGVYKTIVFATASLVIAKILTQKSLPFEGKILRLRAKGGYDYYTIR